MLFMLCHKHSCTVCPVLQMIIKVLLADRSSKTLMVEESQTVRDVLDKLFEKTHCDRGIDWSLCETNPEMHIGEPHNESVTNLHLEVKHQRKKYSRCKNSSCFQKGS